jgi:hypothetical protein
MLGVRTAAWAFVAGCALAAASSLAGTGSASFEVQVNLHGGSVTGPIGGGGNGNGGEQRAGRAVCTSQSEGDASQALVQVLCTLGTFVTIAPTSGLAVEASAAWRTNVGPGSPMAATLAASGGFDPRSTIGTLTSLQVSNATGNSSALEMLVSF